MSKRKREDRNYSKRILKFDRNKLFKGHSGTMAISGGSVPCIELYQTYFGSSVNQRFNPLRLNTMISVYLRSPDKVPNWYRDKFQLISSLHPTDPNDRLYSITIKYDNHDISLYADHYIFAYFEIRAHIAFTDHNENINIIKELSYHKSKILKNFKEIDHEMFKDLKPCFKSSSNDQLLDLDAYSFILSKELL